MTATSDIRPSHADLDALLASTPLTAESRRAVIDALGSADLLWGGASALNAATTDPKGRLLIGEVHRALEKFDDSVRTHVITVLSGVGALA
jgi:hypothetical protein